MATEFICKYSNILGDCHCSENTFPFCQREFMCKYYENCDYCQLKGECQHLSHGGSYTCAEDKW